MQYQSSSSSSSFTTNQKPINIFYVWYSELCRRLNCNPTPVVKPAKPKCQTVLDFVADRLKADEWNPVLNALRHDTSLHVISIRSRMDKCSFMHEIDSEQKVRQLKRRCGLIWTAHIMKSLLKSVTMTIKNSQVLTCLEFDGIPMFNQYLEPLMKALRNNDTLKTLSLSRCKISDIGCQLVCAYVRFAPNIEILNLSCCGLTSESGNHLSKLIKYQQINRYCESWHNSLRYADPNHHIMRGLKRITLNGNPYFGDDGLMLILNVLDDDLWIKALDMQKCGITENISMKILDVVEYNQSLEIADFRLNEQLHMATIEKLFNILKQKQQYGNQSEFQWCNTTLSLSCDSFYDSMSSRTTTILSPSVQKTKSAPIKATTTKIAASNLRKTKTSDSIAKVTKPTYTNETDRKMRILSTQLQEEVAKRREAEKINDQLKTMLEGIRNMQSPIIQRASPSRNRSEMSALLAAIEYYQPQKNGITKLEKQSTSSVNSNLNTTNNSKRMDEGNAIKRDKDGLIRQKAVEQQKKVDNNHMDEEYNASNACSTRSSEPSLILKNMMNKNRTLNGTASTPFFAKRKDTEVEVKRQCSYENGVSDSQISLLHFIETLKCNNTNGNFRQTSIV